MSTISCEIGSFLRMSTTCGSSAPARSSASCLRFAAAYWRPVRRAEASPRRSPPRDAWPADHAKRGGHGRRRWIRRRRPAGLSTTPSTRTRPGRRSDPAAAAVSPALLQEVRHHPLRARQHRAQPGGQDLSHAHHLVDYRLVPADVGARHLVPRQRVVAEHGRQATVRERVDGWRRRSAVRRAPAGHRRGPRRRGTPQLPRSSSAVQRGVVMFAPPDRHHQRRAVGRIDPGATADISQQVSARGVECGESLSGVGAGWLAIGVELPGQPPVARRPLARRSRLPVRGGRGLPPAVRRRTG